MCVGTAVSTMLVVGLRREESKRSRGFLLCIKGVETNPSIK